MWHPWVNFLPCETFLCLCQGATLSESKLVRVYKHCTLVVNLRIAGPETSHTPRAVLRCMESEVPAEILFELHKPEFVKLILIHELLNEQLHQLNRKAHFETECRDFK